MRKHLEKCQGCSKYSYDYAYPEGEREVVQLGTEEQEECGGAGRQSGLEREKSSPGDAAKRGQREYGRKGGDRRYRSLLEATQEGQ